MGNNCACLKNPEEEKQVSLAQPLEFEKNFGRVFLNEEEKSELYRHDIDAQMLISLQSTLRGFIDRKKVKSLYNKLTNNNSINNKGLQEDCISRPSEYVHRTEIKELPSCKVPDYSTHATRNVENMLGPFIYSDSFNDECTTHKLGAVEIENGAIYVGE